MKGGRSPHATPSGPGLDSPGPLGVAGHPYGIRDQAIQKKTAVIRLSSMVLPQYSVALCIRLAL